MFCFFIVDGVGFSLSPAEFVFKNVCCCYFDESTVEFTAFIDYIRNFSLSLFVLRIASRVYYFAHTAVDHLRACALRPRSYSHSLFYEVK